MKGDLHVHTIHSGDGFDTIAQTFAMARAKGLDYIAITDHDTLTHASDPAIASTPELGVIVGAEWTDVGHTGLLRPQSIPPSIDRSSPPSTWAAQMQNVADSVHQDGGAFIVYHPTWASFPNFLPLHDIDAVEIWNSFYTISDTGLHPTSQSRLRSRMTDLGFTAAGVAPCPEIETAVRTPGSCNDQAVAYWEAHLERGRRVAAVGGSDRHRIFLPGYPCTRVLSTSNEPDEIMWAIRSGRTMVTSGPGGLEADFSADADGDGAFETLVGDEIPAGRTTVFRATVSGAQGGKLRIVKRRRVVFETTITQDAFHVDWQDVTAAGDWYRMDVLQPVDWSLPGAAQALQLAQTGGSQSGLPLLSTIASAFGVGVSIGSNFPVVDFDETYLRFLSIDLGDFNMSRAAITSPIYAR